MIEEDPKLGINISFFSSYAKEIYEKNKKKFDKFFFLYIIPPLSEKIPLFWECSSVGRAGPF
jgi:hypothetical protein